MYLIIRKNNSATIQKIVDTTTENGDVEISFK